MDRTPLIDPFARPISYLRVSVTDRCNFRCTYCSPAENEPPGGLLTREELRRLFRLFAGLGVHKIRLTGGEPLTRRFEQRHRHRRVADLVLAADEVVAVAKDTGLVRIYVNGERVYEGNHSHLGIQESEIVLGASTFTKSCSW